MRISKNIFLMPQIMALTMFAAACGVPAAAMVPEVSQMKKITELAAMECYYHNVAKFELEDAAGALFWKKDKHFWVEYTGKVKVGIDASKLKIEVNEEVVTIEIPEAEVLSHSIDQSSLSKDSYTIDKNSAPITAEDETQAFKEAQEQMQLTASQDTDLLDSAGDRVKKVLEGYVDNIGETFGIEYRIVWKDRSGVPESSETTKADE